MEVNGLLSASLFYSLPKEQRKEVMTEDNECDLEPAFMGFVDTYFYLSRLIPKDWTVIDIGCAFNPQCWYFRDHARYIAVEPSLRKMFHVDNTEIYYASAKGFIENTLPTLNLDLDKTFAICNYVPPSYRENPMELVRATFKNIYCFYPK